MSFATHAFLLDASSEPSYLDAFSQLRPGALGCVICLPADQAKVGLALRDAGFELKDTLAYVTARGATHALLAQKPVDKTYANNALKHGCGALNVDGCRVGLTTGEDLVPNNGVADSLPLGGTVGAGASDVTRRKAEGLEALGRFPANLILDGSPEVLRYLPAGAKPKSARTATRGGCNAMHMSKAAGANEFQASVGLWPADPGGSAARFFQPCRTQQDLRAYLAKLLCCPGECLALVSGPAEAVAALESGFSGYRLTGSKGILAKAA